MESVSAVMSGVLSVQRPAAVAAVMADAPAPVGEGVPVHPEPVAPAEVDTDQLNALLHQHQQHLAFSVDKDSGHSVIKVIDTASGDVIRQMPGESWLKLAQELARQAGGLLRTQA